MIRNCDRGVMIDGELDEEDFRDIKKDIELREIELVYLGANSQRLSDFCAILVEWIDGVARRRCLRLEGFTRQPPEPTFRQIQSSTLILVSQLLI